MQTCKTYQVAVSPNRLVKLIIFSAYKNIFMEIKPNTQVCAAFLLLLCIHLWLLLDINTEAALWYVSMSSDNNNNFSLVNTNTSTSSNSISTSLPSSTSTTTSLASSSSATADYSSEVSSDASDGTEDDDDDEEEEEEEEESVTAASSEPALCPALPPGLLGRLQVAEAAPGWEALEAELGGAGLGRGGEWRPAHCRPRHKVAVIIPYRARAPHLRLLLRHLHPLLMRQQLHYRWGSAGW